MVDEAPLTERERFIFLQLTRGTIVTASYCFAMIVFGAATWKVALMAVAVLLLFFSGIGRLKLQFFAAPVFLIAAVEWLDFPILKSLKHIILIRLQNVGCTSVPGG
jgi:hypothetical protein